MATPARCPNGHPWRPTTADGTSTCPACAADSHPSGLSPAASLAFLDLDEVLAGGQPLGRSLDEVWIPDEYLPRPAAQSVADPAGAEPVSVEPTEVISVLPAHNSQQATRTAAPADSADRTGPPVATPSDAGTGPAVVRINGYEVLEEIGRGGMGVVYKARQPGFNRIVALKMLLAGSHAHSREVARFRTEAEAIGRLHHPNIVQVYETGDSEGRPYFSLEFLPGGSLADKLDGTPWTARAAAALIETVARAVHVAHEHGIVHRDLKPGNILLTAAGEPKVGDFGLAKQVESDSNLTETGAVLGSPSYMAPEQAYGSGSGQPGEADVTFATDVYSLGAILYELLCGRPPFRASNPLETILAVATEDPVPPRRLHPRLPRDIETICLKCLEKAAANRYDSARALAEDLRRFAAGEPIQARPAGPAERAVKWVRRNPLKAATAGLLVTVLAVSLLLVVYAGRVAERRLAEALATIEAQSLATLRAEAAGLLAESRASADRGDWDGAAVKAEAARAALAGRPETFDELRATADRLIDLATRRRATADAARHGRARLDRFRARYDDAMFHLGLMAGPDRGRHADAARAAAAEAIATFRFGGDKTGTRSTVQPTPEESGLSSDERAEVASAAYDLCVCQADLFAEGKPTAEAAAKALEMLERAAQIQAPTAGWRRRIGALAATAGRPLPADVPAPTAGDDTDAGEVFRAGMALYRAGDWRAAVDRFDAASRLAPGRFWPTYYAAACRLGLRQYQRASEGFTACIGRRPGFAWGYVLRGCARGETGDFEAAAADFKTAMTVAADPLTRAAVHLHRGVLHVRARRYEAAVDDLTAAARLRPDDPQPHVNAAVALEHLGRIDRAVAEIGSAIRVEPGRADLFRERARLHLLRGDTAAAISDTEEVLRLSPAGAASRPADTLEYARLLHAAGRNTEALGAVDRALAVDPDAPAGLLLRGQALLDLGRWKEAVHALSAGIKLTAGRPDPTAFLARGLAQAQLGDSQAAIEDFSASLVLRPTTQGHVCRGWALLSVRPPALDRAARDFAEAVRLDPTSGPALAGQGYVMARLGQGRDGTAMAKRAMGLSPRRPGVLFTAARTFALAATLPRATSGDVPRLLDAAVDALRQAVEAVPRDDRLAFWRANVYPAPGNAGGQRTNPIDPDLAGLSATPGFIRLDETYRGSRTRRD